MAVNTPAQQLFDLLVTKNFDPELLNSAGMPSENPAETEVFSFDWTSESGNDYGTVVIMLGDDSNLDVYFGDNLGRSMEAQDKQEWFSFLEQLKNFATRNMLGFGTKNLNRLRYSMQSQAAIKESIFESWTGTRTTSWNGRPQEARLMIKHKRPLGETDARFRYVESLFIETAEGERYKLPFTKLSGGRAMVEHIRNGGRPYDARGLHITEMVTELNVLSRFRRSNHGKIFEGDTAQLVEDTNAYYEGLQRTLKSLSGNRGYTTYFELWNPAVITEEEAVVEGLKHLFVTQSIDQRVEDALPLLAKIQQQGQAMKEANIFEAWAEQLAEGTWDLPDTPEKKAKLVDLMSKPLIVGPDATNATEQLYDLIGDDELFDQLAELADNDPNADCRELVYDRLQLLSDDPDVQEVINTLNIDPEAEMNPAEPTDAGMSANPDDAQIPTNEENLEDVTSIGGDSSDEFMADVMTNQQGDEIQESDLDAILRIAGVPAKERPAPNYELEEGGEGTTAQVIKKILDPIAGAMGAAAGGGKAILIQPIGEDETDEGVLGTATGAVLGGIPAGLGGALVGGGAGYLLSKDKKETDEGLGGAFLGGGVTGSALGTAGGIAGTALGGPIGGAVGAATGLYGGAVAGGAAGHKLTKGGSSMIEDGEEETNEGWKGQLAGGTVGTLAGGAAGSTLGPIGATIGSAAGSTAGQMIGDKLGGKEEDYMDESRCNMSEAGEECSVHGMEECWGATAPAVPVAKELDPMLSRMRTLAGFMVK
jgi:hypothetical protein